MSVTENGFWWNRIIRWWAWQKAVSTDKILGAYIEGKKILDIGLGFGVVAEYFKKKGFGVTGIDVVNMSMYEDIQPVLYEGTIIPFKDRSFDTAFLFHVLHHCGNPDKVLKEAVRCAKRVIVVEDTYCSRAGYWRTELNDCLSNMEFKKHKFRSFEKWKEIISNNNWSLESGREWWGLSGMLFPTRYCFLVIEGKTKSR